MTTILWCRESCYRGFGHWSSPTLLFAFLAIEPGGIYVTLTAPSRHRAPYADSFSLLIAPAHIYIRGRAEASDIMLMIRHRCARNFSLPAAVTFTHMSYFNSSAFHAYIYPRVTPPPPASLMPYRPAAFRWKQYLFAILSLLFSWWSFRALLYMHAYWRWWIVAIILLFITPWRMPPPRTHTL